MDSVIKGSLTACLFLLLCSCLSQNAQAQTVSGVVADSSGLPLPGATVEITGTGARTITNVEGAYSLTISRPFAAADVVTSSYSGYSTERIRMNGQTIINQRLQPAANVLDEVVVTALGIRREEKSLGCAAQTVSESAVKDAKTNNWANALTGKVGRLRFF